MKKFTLKILMLVLITTFSGLDLTAQTRIRFARGKSSATVSGTIAKNASKRFVLGARAGQSIEATLSSRSGKVQFLFTFGAGPYRGGTSFSTNAQDGDNDLYIENFGGPSKFILTISIR